MGWNFQTNQFESPQFITVPSTFLCQNAINLFLAEQTRLLTWWNTYWAEKMGCTLKEINQKQCLIGFPVTSNSRGLYFFPTAEREKKDNYRQDKIGFGVVYLTGKTQGDGQQAAKYNDLNESSFYLEAIYSLYDTAPLSKLLAGFPDIPGLTSLPEPRHFTTTILNPDAKFAVLENLGVQAYLAIELIIFPSMISL